MGKGYGSTTIPIQAGIVHDLNTLLKKFKEKDSIRLTAFCEVFRELGMNEIWKGRQSAAELIEFSEKLLQISSTYICSFRQRDTVGTEEMIEHTLEERIFGVYCIYAFYFLQPVDYVTTIRVTPEDFQDIGELFKTVLLPERHLDAACCIYKLIDAGAFRIVPFKNSYDPSFHRRYDVPDCEEQLVDTPFEPFMFITNLASDPLLKQLGIIQEKYDKMRTIHVPKSKACKDVGQVINEQVNLVKRDFVDGIIRSNSLVGEDVDAVRTFLHQIEKGENPVSNISSSKSALKAKAYKSGISYNRNRRYADPNQPDTLDEDVNENNMFKKPLTNKKNNNVKSSLENDNGQTSRHEKKSRVAKRKRTGIEMEDDALPLSLKEGRKATEAKRAKKREEEKMLDAGVLPPIDKQQGISELNPTSVSNFDPEFEEIRKAYEPTAEEVKTMDMVKKLVSGVESVSPKKRMTRVSKNKK